MGNPHPTKSKPCKIGRKHTTAKSLRHLGRIKSTLIKKTKENDKVWRRFKLEVKKFWNGGIEKYPKRPFFALTPDSQEGK